MDAPKTAAARLWATKDVRNHILTFLTVRQQCKILAVDRQTFPILAGMIWKKMTYLQFVAIWPHGIEAKFRWEVYTEAIQELDMRSSLALRMHMHDIPSMLQHFPSLKRVRWFSWDVRFDRRAGVTHFKVLRHIHQSIEMGKPEPKMPASEAFRLPPDWVVEEEEIALHLSRLPRTVGWWPGRLKSSETLLLSPRVKELYWWFNELSMYSPRPSDRLVALLDKRKQSDHFLRKLAFHHLSDAMELHDVRLILKSIGPGIEVLHLPKRSNATSPRQLLEIKEWHLVPRLKVLDMPCRAMPVEYCPVAVSAHAFDTPITTHGPPDRIESVSSPIDAWEGPALDLDRFTLRLEDWGNDFDFADMVDSLPRLSDLARAMIAIGGPNCTYLLHPWGQDHRETDKYWVHTFRQTLNILLQREIYPLLGRRTFPRIVHPTWRNVEDWEDAF